jgi:nucleotide-binding universal stress UspA family protein
MLAGEGTKHAGFGPCEAHGNAAQHRAWELALDVARDLDVSPWEALLLAVRRAGGRVAWVDAQLAEATRRFDGDQDQPTVRRWLKESRLERTLLARTAKAAIDAGVAERLVRQVELEGQVVAEVLGRTLDALELSPEARQLAFATAQRELLALDPADGARPVSG